MEVLRGNAVDAVQAVEADTPSSVEKALAVLDVLADVDDAIGVSEVGRRAGLPKSTAFRLLSLLEAAEIIERHGQKYRVGYRLFELGNSALRTRPHHLRDVAMPELVELYVRTKQIVHLGVLEGTDVLYLEKLFGRASPATPSAVGTRMPATCCGLGKAMLAFSDGDTIRGALERLPVERRTPYTCTQPGLFMDELRSIHKSGVAFDREESAMGLACIAVPVLDAQRRPLGAISLTGRTGTFDPSEYVVGVRRTAVGISRALQAAM